MGLCLYAFRTQERLWVKALVWVGPGGIAITIVE